ncbi:DUF397 domain-containing protein [Streptomyces sp. ISL-111]|uniref:DUF397 domain-containing protein n=1 Tax=unclassified Streptomyces TaxID=2593676 RepID=UPI001BEAB431|nr:MULTISPECIES: DUF397 domain-containing protein [unclassified Streptomyces]MBT2381426.1 DUF397 domain-containing protein [Streptomyces sp. ISL-111]MBT2424337.1 DUF397 domain-containing protein [Streptomyces sp. ISL-112]MBT2463657.1 DUF397 domain-containing protein [Streptomyces sp. ISL-63]
MRFTPLRPLPGRDPSLHCTGRAEDLKSSFSATQEQCVEITEHSGQILMRESDDPGTVAVTSREKFAAFIKGVKAGEFDHFDQ